MEVHARALRESTDDPLCLASLQCAVKVELVLEKPLGTDDIRMWWPWHKCPCAVHLKSVEFHLHGCEPLWIMESSLNRRWWWHDGVRCGHVHVLGVRQSNDVPSTHDHWVLMRR